MIHHNKAFLKTANYFTVKDKQDIIVKKEKNYSISKNRIIILIYFNKKQHKFFFLKSLKIQKTYQQNSTKPIVYFCQTI